MKQCFSNMTSNNMTSNTNHKSKEAPSATTIMNITNDSSRNTKHYSLRKNPHPSARLLLSEESEVTTKL